MGQPTYIATLNLVKSCKSRIGSASVLSDTDPFHRAHLNSLLVPSTVLTPSSGTRYLTLVTTGNSGSDRHDRHDHTTEYLINPEER